MKTPLRTLLLLMPLLLAGCGALQRLSEVGRPPAMTPTSDPTRAPTWRPLTMPMPNPRTASPSPNALWLPGSRAFFKDQRASQVGDIVTILINTNDSADVENATSATRTGSESMGLPNLFGLEALIPHMMAGANPANLISGSTGNSNVGTGVLKRKEAVALSLAGVITQVLPNGNLVISAHQEMRVNSELRDLRVTGVIRPQDISSENTIDGSRVAEARISYGGRGQLTGVQTPRWGQQVLDILSPF